MRNSLSAPWLAGLIIFSSLGGASYAWGFTVHADFEGGNAEVVRLDNDLLTLRIMPELHDGTGWPCWWYFRADDLPVGKVLTLEVQAQTRPFDKSRRLAANWCQPKHASLSDDNRHWRLSPSAEIQSGIATYRLEITRPTMWFAWGPPFLPSQAEALLIQAERRNPAAERFPLATSRQGRTVWGIRVGDINAPRQVWVNARQHAWESGGSWVGKGFLDWLVSDKAESFRKNTCTYFIPLMDVDHVAQGAGGKEATPRDHNRDWTATPHYPEVAAAQQRLLAIHQKQGLDLYIDLHNPGASDPIFFFGPHDLEQMVGPQKRNYVRWIQTAAERMRLPIAVAPTYRVATYVTSEEERSRMSSNWVRDHVGNTAVAVTLETGWNVFPMLATTYETVGEQLGTAMAEYFQDDPRRNE